MPVTPTYPGVYIEEIPSGVRTITGVATSITAFIGYTAQGPVDKAVQYSISRLRSQLRRARCWKRREYAVQRIPNRRGEAGSARGKRCRERRHHAAKTLPPEWDS